MATQAVSETRTIAAAQYRRGALLVAGAALAWSSAGIITRLTTTDGWTTLFWRSVFSTLFLAAYILWRDRGGAISSFRALGLGGLGVGAAFGTSMTCFIIALKQTAVANVLIFQASAPFVAALLAWAWLGEKVSRRSRLLRATTGRKPWLKRASGASPSSATASSATASPRSSPPAAGR